MTWLSPAQRRPQRSRRGLVAIVLATTHLLAGPVHAATQSAARAPCPNDPAAAPPSEALALKNAAQEMRAASSWAKASRLFRDAVEELPDCATYADERLRWSLWAVETFEQTELEDDGQLLRATEDAVTRIEATPNGRLLPDFPTLVSARDRLRASAPWRPFARKPPRDDTPRQRPPMAIRLGIGLMASGAPLLISGSIVAGVYSARAQDLNNRLTGPGGIYEQWSAAGCGPAAEPGEASACAGLRDARTDVRSDGRTSNRAVVTSLVLIGVGSALLLAGLGTYLHGRKLQRTHSARLRVLPTFGGLSLSGSF